jgi:hypothetical protein
MAWAAYRDHDRVVILDDPISLHERAVDDWWQAHQAGHHALLLAGTRAETRALNRLARRHAEDAGLLTGHPLEVAGRDFRVGDRVVLLHNDGDQSTPAGAPVRVDNGMLARIIAIDHS